MTVLVTGAAGFIGFHVSRALLARGDQVVGIDNLNDYYDVTLKQARLGQLNALDGFAFEEVDIADAPYVEGVALKHQGIYQVVHLAAEAGVRYSIKNPHAYARSNLNGQMSILEFCRNIKGFKNLVFASSSSVYGGNEKLPFSTDDNTDQPVSFYAATKKSGEILAYSYAHLYGFPCTGLRFFTVYGPWGRPDMAYFSFTKKIFAGETIDVFNNGEMGRDFAYIDDIVAGVLAALDRPATGEPPYAVYNLGNNQSVELLDFIKVIENEVGREAIMDFKPMQAGDVKQTFADIDLSRRDLGFDPKTGLIAGIKQFIDWYRDYYGNEV